MPVATEKSMEWVRRVIEQNPCRLIDGGNIVTCPVRLGFPYLDKPQKAMEEGKPDKYAATLLFQHGSDISVIKEELARVAQAEWGEKLMEYMKDVNFHNPIFDQGKKAYEGFEPGFPAITATGERKPGVVMQNLAPYTGRIYPGMWAICVIRPFPFNTKNRQGTVLKRGLGFGLQQVMIVADDTEFGGGSVDVAKAFAGVKIDGDVNPAAAFGSGDTQAKTAVTAADLF